MAGYRILSFDGGPASFTILNTLVYVERLKPGFLASTNMFVGSSAGAWVAAYLARNLVSVDRGETSSVDLLQRCLVFLTSAGAAAAPVDPGAALRDFLLGKGALSDTTRVEALMRDPSNYGDDSLGNVHRRLVIQAGCMCTPWRPRIYDSASVADLAVPLYDAALCSGSFPLVFPIRNGQVDGMMFTNAPAMAGVAQAVAGTSAAERIPLDQIRLLALGSDDGSSNLSNLAIPTDPPLMPGSAPSPRLRGTPRFDGGTTAAPRKLDVPDHDRMLAALQGSFRAASAELKAVLERANTEGDHGLGDAFPRSLLGALQRSDDEIADVRKEIALALGSPEPAVSQRPRVAAPTQPNWGWPQWLAYPLNPLYLLQVLINSEGRGVADVSTRLLGGRAFRLAPVGFLDTNVAFLLLMLGEEQAVVDAAKLTAEQWSIETPRWLADLYGFHPGIAEAERWIQDYW